MVLNKIWRLISKTVAYVLVSAIFSAIALGAGFLLAFIITLIVG